MSENTFQRGNLIYPVDVQIANLLSSCVDEETGEVLCTDEEMEAAIYEIKMEFDEKIKQLRNAYKDADMNAKMVAAEAKALREEASAVQKRSDVYANKAERIKRLMAWLLQGETFDKDGVKVGYRMSKETEIDDGFIEWAKENAPQFLNSTVRKADVMTALKNGENIEFARIKENRNIQIK